MQITLVLIFDSNVIKPCTNPILKPACKLYITALVTRGWYLVKDGESLPKLFLQVGARSKALELSIDHDGQPVAQRLILLHAVAGQHHGLTVSLDSSYDGPEVPPGHRIHSCTWLVKKHKRRLTHQGHGHIQFSLIPSTVAAGLTVDVSLNTDCISNNTIDVFLITESSKPPQTGLNNYNHFEDLYSQEIRPSLHLSLYGLRCHTSNPAHQSQQLSPGQLWDD